MKKFKFRLETLQRYRKILEDREKKEFSLIHMKVVEKEMEISNLGKQMDSMISNWAEKKNRGFSFTEECQYAGYLEHLKRKRKKTYVQLDLLKKDEEIKRSKLIEASRKRMTIDKLKENMWNDYLKEYSMEENKTIGELAQISYCRKLRFNG